MTEIPILKTERLVLRGRTETDFDAYAAMWDEPTVWRFTLGSAVSREDHWRRFLGLIGHWTLRGYGYWVVADRATGAYLGEVGFSDFHRETEPSIEGAPDAGWMFRTSAQRKGYAAEATAAAHDWWDAAMSGARLAALIHPDNAPSMKLAARFGYAELGRGIYRGLETVVLLRGT